MSVETVNYIMQIKIYFLPSAPLYEDVGWSGGKASLRNSVLTVFIFQFTI